MSRSDIAVIEKIVRQQWYDASDTEQSRFESWIDVDQDQALALLEMIPDRLPVKVDLLPWPDAQRDPATGAPA